MTELITIQNFSVGAVENNARLERGRLYCEALEKGNILFFEQSPFPLPAGDREFLLSQRQSGAAYHKNIAYRPREDRVTGLAQQSAEDQERLRGILRSYSQRVTQFLSELLPLYTAGAKVDFASFRPQEERGRPARVNARNDLLHVDSFPTRPTYGDRTMRVFTNINPKEPRVWLTSETFDELAQRFTGPQAPRGLFPERGEGSSTLESLRHWAHKAGLPVKPPSPYDDFMHKFHNFLKHNAEFQEKCKKTRWEFPPNSSWIVFTDMVSHAVLSGQFAMEQTYIISRKVLALPQKAPISILEQICGRPLSNN